MVIIIGNKIILVFELLAGSQNSYPRHNNYEIRLNLKEKPLKPVIKTVTNTPLRNGVDSPTG